MATHSLQLAFQARRQNREPHHLDEPDVFPLDMMPLLMRMEDAQRVCLAGDVAA